MNKYLVLFLLVFSQTVSAHDFPGYRAGNYTGILNVYLLLTALTSDSKQADVHVGLRFGGLQKNKEKKREKKERKAAKEDEEKEEKAVKEGDQQK